MAQRTGVRCATNSNRLERRRFWQDTRAWSPRRWVGPTAGGVPGGFTPPFGSPPPATCRFPLDLQVYQPTGRKALKGGLIQVKERHAFVVFFYTDESGFVPVGQVSAAWDTFVLWGEGGREFRAQNAFFCHRASLICRIHLPVPVLPCCLVPATAPSRVSCLVPFPSPRLQNAIESFESRPDLLNLTKKSAKLTKAINCAQAELVAMAEVGPALVVGAVTSSACLRGDIVASSRGYLGLERHALDLSPRER